MASNVFADDSDSEEEIAVSKATEIFGDDTDESDDDDAIVASTSRRIRRGRADSEDSEEDGDDNFGRSDQSVQRNRKRRRLVQGKKKMSPRKVDTSSAYDKEEVLEETAEDKAFLDNDDDDQDILNDYASKDQIFYDEQRDSQFEKEENQQRLPRGDKGRQWARGKPVISKTEKLEKALAILEKMEKAADDDEIIWKRQDGTPAVNKLKNLKWVIANVRKESYRNELLEHNLCGVIEKWLRPLPSGALCNKRVRVAMYDLLEELPIKESHLQFEYKGVKCRLGKVLIQIAKSKGETVANKTRIGKIIQKWMRPVLLQSSSYKDRTDAIDRDSRTADQLKRAARRRRKRSAGLRRASKSSDPKPGERGFSWVPLNPQKFEFRNLKRVPVTKIQEKKKIVSKRSQEIAKSLLQMKRKAKAKSSDSAAYKMSMNGRGM